MKQPSDLSRAELIDLVEHLQGHLYLDIAPARGGDEDLAPKDVRPGAAFWNPDKIWDADLLASLASRLESYGLVPREIEPARFGSGRAG